MLDKSFEPNWNDQQIAYLHQLYHQFDDSLPEMVSLDGKQRQRSNPIGDVRSGYANKIEETGVEYADELGLKPHEVLELQEVAYNFKQLMRFKRKIDKLAVKFRDTSIFVGDNFYSLCGVVHDAVRHAVKKGKPGMSAILEELDKLYANQGNHGGGSNEDTNSNDNPPTDQGGGPGAA
jgi:hypothetical protein